MTMKVHTSAMDNKTDDQVEEDFLNLSVVIRADRQTLRKRFRLQKARKETAETQWQEELAELERRVQVLSKHCNGENHQLQRILKWIQSRFPTIKSRAPPISVIKDWLVFQEFGALSLESKASAAAEVMSSEEKRIQDKREIQQKSIDRTKELLKKHNVDLATMRHSFSLLPSDEMELNEPSVAAGKSKDSSWRIIRSKKFKTMSYVASAFKYPHPRSTISRSSSTRSLPARPEKTFPTLLPDSADEAEEESATVQSNATDPKRKVATAYRATFSEDDEAQGAHRYWEVSLRKPGHSILRGNLRRLSLPSAENEVKQEKDMNGRATSSGSKEGTAQTHEEESDGRVPPAGLGGETTNSSPVDPFFILLAKTLFDLDSTALILLSLPQRARKPLDTDRREHPESLRVFFY
ncbi:unnamed protein product [Cyprideis torosa]|uniref:Uncharacterized protein n=1 Tax=Cyprideis torosa TaxID=163714 RepID=A0A7R8ZKN8_9CRUS|nr:unnamed protein product [Cyprideis torosa]CAG0891482.1 unnamed protein product [Cyprideis torosa]